MNQSTVFLLMNPMSEKPMIVLSCRVSGQLKEAYHLSTSVLGSRYYSLGTPLSQHLARRPRHYRRRVSTIKSVFLG